MPIDSPDHQLFRGGLGFVWKLIVIENDSFEVRWFDQLYKNIVAKCDPMVISVYTQIDQQELVSIQFISNAIDAHDHQLFRHGRGFTQKLIVTEND